MCGSNNPPGKDVNITLSVSASSLYNANPQPTSQTDLDAYCSLSDDNKGTIPPGQTLNDYTTEVYSKHKVSWDGVSSDDAGYRVLIDSISNNPNFFKDDPPGSSGKVTADLKDGINGVEDTYTINFSIDPPGNGTPKSYSLDPKLMGKG